MKIPKEFKLVVSQIESRKRLYFGIAAAVFASAGMAFIPYIYGHLVDVAIAPNSQIKMIFQLIFLWLILSFVSDWLNRYSAKRAYEIATDVTNKLIVNLFHHLLNLPLKFHKEKKMGKVMRRVGRGIDQLFDLIDKTVFNFLPALITFIIALIILLFVQWQLSLILLIAVTCYVLATFFYTKEIIKTQKIMHRSWEKAYGDLWDSVTNVRAVKSSTAEEFERKRSIKNFNLAGRIFKNWRWIWLKMSLWQKAIFTLSFIVVFSLGVLMLRVGALTPGTLIMFVGYTSLLTSPLAQLADQYRSAKSAMTAFCRAAKYYDLIPEKDLPLSKELKDIKGKVVFEDVSFGYKKDRPILKNISFEAWPGQTIALVGESGVGKTTFVDLIGRYYLPQKGSILIDDVNIRKIKLKSLREQMALVPQEVLLFNDTIKNNIRYGQPQASDKQVIEAAKAANAHEFIESFSRKYEQIVGERGIKLSAGQKQRIAIARAILRNPKILILDEATSALDSVSEKLVQEALQRLIQSRTTFIIAHRLSTIMRADKIVVLEKGKIAEMGTHQELMQNPEGIYRNFWELQAAIQKAE